MNDTKVIGVINLETYDGCMKSGAKVHADEIGMGSCGKCGILQQMGFCKKQCAVQMVVAAGDTQLTAIIR